MVDRDVENGMVLYAEKPQTLLTCPHCGAEWEKFIDRDPIGVGTVYYEHDFDLTRHYPIHKGFCRACALESATAEERVAFIRENNLISEFFGFIFGFTLYPSAMSKDMLDIWNLLVNHDPDLLEIRLREFIEDERKDDFINWRCEE